MALVPKNESGLVSRMAHLEGLAAVRPSRHLELLPYASARAEYVEPPAGGSPWNDGSRYAAGAGLDLEYGLGSGLTLVGAFNPDFGQVEVDPAVVNLTAFETFFEEKRPFFTEGSQVFLRFGRSGSSDTRPSSIRSRFSSTRGASDARRRASRRAPSWTSRPRPRSWARRSSSAGLTVGTSGCSRR